MKASDRIPLWKWVLLIIFGPLVFLFLYGLAEVPTAFVENPPLEMALLALGSLVLVVLFACWCNIFEKSWPDCIFSGKAGKHLILGFGTGVLYFCIIAGVLAMAGVYKAKLGSDSWLEILGSLFFFLLVAVGEEIVFRGFIFRMIDERFNFVAALVVSALIFGFIHMGNSNATLWSSVAIAVEAGLLLGAAYKYSGTIWLPIGIHWAWNFTQGNVFGFSVSGMPSDVSVFDAMVSGPEILSGGEFGPEASVITVALGVIFTLFFISGYYRRNY